MHPTVYSLFADERAAGFRREAAADRLANLARTQSRPTVGGRVRQHADPARPSRSPTGA